MTETEPDRFEATSTADVRADVVHPDRPLTAEERAHLGLTEEEAS